MQASRIVRRVPSRFARNLLNFKKVQSPSVKSTISRYPTGLLLNKSKMFIPGFGQHSITWTTQIGNTEINLDLNNDNNFLTVSQVLLPTGEHYKTVITPETILKESNGTCDLGELFAHMKMSLIGNQTNVSIFNKLDMQYVNEIYQHDPKIQWTLPIRNNHINIRFPIELYNVRNLKRMLIKKQNYALLQGIKGSDKLLNSFSRNCILGKCTGSTCIGACSNFLSPTSSIMSNIGRKGIISPWTQLMRKRMRFVKLRNLHWMSGKNVIKNGLECKILNGSLAATSFLPTSLSSGNIYFEVDVHKLNGEGPGVFSVNGPHDNYQVFWYSDGSLCVGGRRTEIRRERLGHDLINTVLGSDHNESAIFKQTSSLPGKIKLPLDYDKDSIFKRKENPIATWRQNDRLGVEFDLSRRTVSFYKNGKLVKKDAACSLPRTGVHCVISAPKMNGYLSAVLNPSSKHPIIQLIDKVHSIPSHSKMQM